jgi:hypothetical protein
LCKEGDLKYKKFTNISLVFVEGVVWNMNCVTDLWMGSVEGEGWNINWFSDIRMGFGEGGFKI